MYDLFSLEGYPFKVFSLCRASAMIMTALLEIETSRLELFAESDE